MRRVILSVFLCSILLVQTFPLSTVQVQSEFLEPYFYLYGYVVSISDNTTFVVVGVTVKAESNGEVYSNTSSITGFYKIRLPAGKYNVTASKVVDGFVLCKTNRTYEINAIEDTRLDVEVVCKSVSMLIGNVLDINTNEPLKNATVKATRKGESRLLLTDKLGFFSTFLESGNYTIKAEAFGYQPSPLANLSVPPSKFIAFRLKTEPMGIFGFVYDDLNKPLRNVAVCITGKIGNRTVYGPFLNTTGPSGFYSFKSLPPAEYEILTSKLGYSVEVADISMPPGGKPVPQNFTLRLNASTLEVVVKSKTYNDRPLKGVNVTLTGVKNDSSEDWTNGEPQLRITDAEGKVRFERLLPGRYVVNATFNEPVIVPQDLEWFPGKGHFLARYYNTTSIKSVKEGENELLQVYMEPVNGTLDVLVSRIRDIRVDLSGLDFSYLLDKPEEFNVQVVQAVSPDGRQKFNLTKSLLDLPKEALNGTFIVQLPPGSYLLRFEKEYHWAVEIWTALGSGSPPPPPISPLPIVFRPAWDYVLGFLKDGFWNEKVINATVSAGNVTTCTDINGMYVLQRVEGNRTQILRIEATGYNGSSYPVWLPGAASVVVLNETWKVVSFPLGEYEGRPLDRILRLGGEEYDFGRGPPYGVSIGTLLNFQPSFPERLPNVISPLGNLGVTVYIRVPVYDDEGRLTGSRLEQGSANIGIVTPSYEVRSVSVSYRTTIKIPEGRTSKLFINGWIYNRTNPHEEVRPGSVTLILTYWDRIWLPGDWSPPTEDYTYAIFGRVYDMVNLKFLENVNVRIDTATRTTDLQGGFSITGRAPSPTQLIFIKDGYATRPEPVYAYPVSVVHVPMDPQAVNVNLTVLEGRSNVGELQIRGESRPVNGTSVALWIFNDKTDANGRYQLPGSLGLGEYDVWVWKPGYEPKHFRMGVVLPDGNLRDSNLDVTEQVEGVRLVIPRNETSADIPLNKNLTVWLKPLPWLKLVNVTSRPRLGSTVMHGISLVEGDKPFLASINVTLRRASIDDIAEKYRWDEIVNVNVTLKSLYGSMNYTFAAKLIGKTGLNETWEAKFDVPALTPGTYSLYVDAVTRYGSKICEIPAYAGMKVLRLPPMLYATYTLGEKLAKRGPVEELLVRLGGLKIENEATAEINLKENCVIYASSVSIDTNGPQDLLPPALKPIAGKIIPEIPSVRFNLVFDFHGGNGTGDVIAILNVPLGKAEWKKTVWETDIAKIEEATSKSIAQSIGEIVKTTKTVERLSDKNLFKRRILEVTKDMKKDVLSGIAVSAEKGLTVKLLLFKVEAEFYVGVCIHANLYSSYEDIVPSPLFIGPGFAIKLKPSLRIPVENVLLLAPGVGQAACTFVKAASLLGIDLLSLYIKGEVGGGINFLFRYAPISVESLIPLGFGIGIECNVAIFEGEAWARMESKAIGEYDSNLGVLIMTLSLPVVFPVPVLLRAIQPKSFEADVILEGELSLKYIIGKKKLWEGKKQIPLIYEYFGTESLFEVRDMDIRITPGTRLMEDFVGCNNTILTKAFHSAYPGAVYDAAGLSHIIYSGDNLSLRYPQSFIVKHTSRVGDVWSMPEQLGFGLRPSMTLLRDGKLLATWSVYTTNLTEEIHSTTKLYSVEAFHSIYTPGEGWSKPLSFTNNTFADLAPQVYCYQDGAVAVWLADEDSEILTIDDNTLYYSFFNGSRWSAPKNLPLTSKVWGIPSISTHGKNIIVTFEVDMDNNPATTWDREIYYGSFDGEGWSEPVRLTDNKQGDQQPSATFLGDGNVILTWIVETNEEDSLVTSSFNGVSWSKPQPLTKAPRISEPKILVGTTGAVLLYLAPSGNSSSSIYYMVYNVENHTWTEPTLLTPDDYAYEQLSATLYEGTGDVTAVAVGRRGLEATLDLKYFTFKALIPENILILKTPPTVKVAVGDSTYVMGSTGMLVLKGLKETVNLSIQKTVNMTPKTRLNFESWSDGYKKEYRELSLKGLTNLEATYKKQHMVEVISDRGIVEGTGWYDEGSEAKASVESTKMQVAWILVQDIFEGWRGDITSDKPTITLEVDSPKEIMAVWKRDYTGLVIVLIVIALAVTSSLILKRKIRSKTINTNS